MKYCPLEANGTYLGSPVTSFSGNSLKGYQLFLRTKSLQNSRSYGFT